MARHAAGGHEGVAVSGEGSVRTERRVLQILPAQGTGDREPVFRVAYYEDQLLLISPVVAWALVRYLGKDRREVIEPVWLDVECGLMRVGRTDESCPVSDVILRPGETATGIRWLQGLREDGTDYLVGSILVEGGDEDGWNTETVPVEPPKKP